MWYTRKMWGARKRRHAPGRLNANNVIGLAIHWPGMSHPLKTVPEVKAAIRGWQNYHMDSHGWSDIAYNEGIDQSGNVYRMRGAANRSAANGDYAVNTSHVAILLILASGEQPSKKMLKKVRTRIKKYRRRYPRVKNNIKPHWFVQGRGTECPGAIVTALINDGTIR